MRLNSVSPVSFQAQIPKNLHEQLFREANLRGHNCCEAFFSQTKKFGQWGQDEATSLCCAFEKSIISDERISA